MFTFHPGNGPRQDRRDPRPHPGQPAPQTPPRLVSPVSVKQPLPPIPKGGVPSKATLVVCAVSLVGQWISEAKGKLSAPINMYKYHGQGRSSDPYFLAGHDIVREALKSMFHIGECSLACAQCLDSVSPEWSLEFLPSCIVILVVQACDESTLLNGAANFGAFRVAMHSHPLSASIFVTS